LLFSIDNATNVFKYITLYESKAKTRTNKVCLCIPRQSRVLAYKTRFQPLGTDCSLKKVFISSIYRWRNLHWVVGHARGIFKENLELHVTSSDAELIVKFIGRRG